VHGLKYYEQRVNNRFGTSSAPAIDASLLPETASDHRLKWRRIPLADVAVYEDGSGIATEVASALTQDDCVLVPIHPIEADRWPGESFVESGVVQVSASYRTMFFEPDADGLLTGVAGPEAALMMKLHLERPLPGIPGDRRLSRQIVHKCVTLSAHLQRIMADDPLGAQCEVVPEFLGFSSDETGVIFRTLPRRGVMPLFAMFSSNAELEGGSSHIESALRRLYGDDAAGAAANLGDELARPLLRPLFAGFRAGFSLEMHAQNVLFRPGKSTLIDRVFIRDLEGVVFSNRYREAQGMESLFEDTDNAALVTDSGPMSRWFNRNVDHDLGRVFTASLEALVRNGYFGERERALATRSIRRAARQCVQEADLGHLNWAGRILPISRSPYGNGLSKGYWYRSRYR
jgi:hypothetical protein